MPELPEVETTLRGIAPHIDGRNVVAVHVHDSRLRWPVPADLPEKLVGHKLLGLERRAKYLLLHFRHGTLILHLGMSGSLRVVDPSHPRTPHDHLEIIFSGRRCLRLRDPRRFGAALWTEGEATAHQLLCALGPEPLSDSFDVDYLHAITRQRRAPIKNVIMDGHVVVGVGNIYASESLHMAGIHPARSAHRIAPARLARLVVAIKEVLADAIASGGTTLRDFTDAQGKPGYFRHHLRVYDRENLPCECGRGSIRRSVLGQRATYFCPACQR
ncbi:MAG: bifunctional DNA-formamidopyrimidine glycosylase/DNA-(apurinic or apyrimidinic site) lyase [Gammaproteobacteria bacterium]|nr:bifunctional DNA-formamidopyrimidine glycosylase/DNA-(apurinic or apyrimidinic site) lyase [Gammaproteobacteria bacterium]